MAQVVEIFSHWRQGPANLVESIPWLLMLWQPKESRNQWPWHWPSFPGIFRPSAITGYGTLHDSDRYLSFKRMNVAFTIISSFLDVIISCFIYAGIHNITFTQSWTTPLTANTHNMYSFGGITLAFIIYCQVFWNSWKSCVPLKWASVWNVTYFTEWKLKMINECFKYSVKRVIWRQDANDCEKILPSHQLMMTLLQGLNFRSLIHRSQWIPHKWPTMQNFDNHFVVIPNKLLNTPPRHR